MGANYGLHPLIHTPLNFALAQDIVAFQRFTGFSKASPQTGHTLSVGFIITLSLPLGYLTGWTFTRLISLEPGFVIGLFRVRKFWLWWAETGN